MCCKMGSNQMYSLTWGEFGTSLMSAVQLLRCHSELVDVTLAAGGRSFPAHKIVLCAASPFLLNLLKSTPCQHPVVMLAGVTAPDLEALLEFMYRGEVSVDPGQLPSLLQAAHCLNIQGLAPGTISAEKPEEISSVSTAHEALTKDVINSFLPIRRRKRPKHRNSTGSVSKWARHDSLSTDGENEPVKQQNGGNGATLLSQQDILNMSDVPRKSEEAENSPHNGEDSNIKKSSVSDQPASCPLCGAILRQSRNLRRHLELLHFGVGRSTVRVRSRKSSVVQPHQSQETSSSLPVMQSPHTPPSASQSSIHVPMNTIPPVNVVPHSMVPPACQNQGVSGLEERPGSSSLCEPSPILGCMLPPMPSPHDTIFRQHHSDLLRGAGLYAETRGPTRNTGNSAIRQEVV